MPLFSAADKVGLRKAVKAYYQTPKDESASDSALQQRFCTLDCVRRAQIIMLYFSVGEEPDTVSLWKPLNAMGKTLALPRCLPGREMEARLWEGPESLSLGTYGIPEPGPGSPLVCKEDLDLILVPNLLCDRRGYRLGHGCGYYDRYLTDFTGFTVAFCRDALLQDKIPAESFDIPIQLVLTETECLSHL